MSKVSIGFFDDHPILLEGLVNIFSRFNDFAIVERGASAADAVIPTSIDHDLCAQSRRPMDIIFQG